MTFVDVHGLVLHVRRDARRVPAAAAAPAAAPTLVFLHSLGTELRIWDGVVARLPDHDRVRLDLRGHGLSAVPPGAYRIADLAEDVLGVLDALGVTRAVLIGVSVGGQVALRAALERPAVVRAVVAMATAGRIRDRAAWEARIAEVRRVGIDGVADETVGRWLGPGGGDDALLAGLRQMFRRTPVDGYLATCAALRDEDLNPRLASMAQPVLALCGRHDVATPPALVRGLAQAVPDGRYLELDGAAHLPCLDHAAAVAAHVDGFLRGEGATGC